MGIPKITNKSTKGHENDNLYMHELIALICDRRQLVSASLSRLTVFPMPASCLAY